MAKVRILVLNYNAKHLLERFLPSVLQAAAASRYGCAVTVLDNQSRDGSADYVRERFALAEVFEASANRVLCSYNEAARHYTEDVLIFLNNDIRPDRDFVDPLAELFDKRPDAFFASTYGDRARPRFHWGVLAADIYYPGFEHAILREGLSLSAGIGAFDRKKFLALGGYDDMYLPGYYEDVDLCYRAWKRGWKGYYVPQSRQFHMGGATFNKTYDAATLQKLVYRNSLLFMLKNISDPVLSLKFRALLLLRRLTAALLGRRFILDGYREAMAMKGTALKGREIEKKHWKRSDRSILGELARELSTDRRVRS